MSKTGAEVEIGMTFDCADATGQAQFWASALGYVQSPPPEGWDTWESWFGDHDVPPDEWDDGAAICDPTGRQPAISFLRVPESKRTKNRLHLDLKVSGGRHIPSDERTRRIDNKMAELIAAGAIVQERHLFDGRLDHVVMLDPEGNEFCVV